jgi:hypothetical protein
VNVITGSYLLLCALLLLVLVPRQVAWWGKLPIIVLTPLMTFAVWSAAATFSGWPTDAAPAARSVFVWGAVYEPNQATRDNGEILLWLIPLDYRGSLLGYQPNGREPRSYRLPYSRQLHEQVSQAVAETKAGQQVEFDRFKSKQHGEPGRAGRSAGGGTQVPKWAFRAHPLPPAIPTGKSRG